MKNDIEKARLLWRCRRGMLELDLLLERFMNQAFDHLTPAQLEVFQKILQEQDPDLYAWLMGYEVPPTQEFKDFIVWFRERICQAKI
jgi:antitoxin CptB